MPTIHTMPRPEAFRDLLTDLVGVAVAVDRGRGTMTGEDAHVVAHLVRTEDGELGALCVFELGLAAALGAAFTKMPPVVVERSARRGVFEEGRELPDNFREVMKISTQLFNSTDTPQLELGSVVVPPGGLAPDTSHWLRHAARRDLEVMVDGYGAGRVSVFVD